MSELEGCSGAKVQKMQESPNVTVGYCAHRPPTARYLAVML